MNEGSFWEFTVVAKNSRGTVVPISDASVELDSAELGTVSVNPDGSGGVFQSTDGPGTVNLTPKAGGVVGVPYPLEITADMGIATVEIVPAAPASVEILPA